MIQKKSQIRTKLPVGSDLHGAVGVSERDWHDQGQVLCHPNAKIDKISQ